MYARNNTVFVYINDALVGVMNEQFNSIKMHRINNVKRGENSAF